MLGPPPLGYVTEAAWTSDFSNITALPPENHDLTFNLINIGGVTPGSQAEAGFQRAATLWQSFVGDAVTIRLDVGFSSLGPGILGSTGSNSKVVSYSAVRTALIADQSSSDDAAAVASLFAGPSLSFFTNNSAGARVFDNDGSANNTFLDVNTANLKALGITIDANGQPVDTGAADGNITFSSNFTWDFDPSNGITAGAFDFVGVAFHEIGHALGFVSGVDAVDFFSGSGPGAPLNLNPFAVFNTLDLFRYSASGVRELSFGGSPYFSLNSGATNLALFSTGRNQGDGQQASHWKDNLGIGIMDPTMAAGQAGIITARDIQSMDVIGWNRAGAGGPTDDYPANTSTTGQVAINGSNTGTLEVAGDHDWFRVQLSVGASYLIDLLGAPTGAGTLSDPYLRLYNSGGQLLAQNDDFGGTFNSHLAYSPSVSGTYYVDAGAFADSYSGTYRVAVSGPSQPAGRAANDFNGDLRSDIFWRTNGGALAVWEMNGNQIGPADYVRNGNAVTGAPGSDWHLVGTDAMPADFDGDGKGDLLWWTDSGAVAIWKMDGSHINGADYTRLGSGIVGRPGSDWHIADTGDFDGNAKADILWRTDSGALAIWKMDGTQISGADYIRLGQTAVGAPGADWHILGVADFDGDGKGDLLWRTDSGALALWEMDGTQIKAADYLRNGSSPVGRPGADWNIVGTGDFDGDGKADILWQTNGGALALWEMDGNQIKAADYLRIGASAVGRPGADWHVAGTGDFNGDGMADILWRTDGGSLALWQMDGSQIGPAGYLKIGQTNVGAPGTDWNIVQHQYDLL